MLTMCVTDQCSREASQSHPTRGCHFKEFVATRKSTPSGNPRIVRHLRIGYRSGTNRRLDSRLSILEEGNQLKSDELGIDSNQMEAIGTSVP